MWPASFVSSHIPTTFVGKHLLEKLMYATPPTTHTHTHTHNKTVVGAFEAESSEIQSQSI